MDKEKRISMIRQRAIEAGMAAELIREYAVELGHEKAVGIAARAVRRMAREAGAQAAVKLGGNSLADFARVVREFWSQENALAIDFREETPERLAFNVTRCRYAEQYEEMGVRELGFCLSCNRDAAFAQGFNPAMTMRRTQTIMEGAPFCDFRFALAERW
ncbi:2-amino-thiazoline-4-carboxylic acid hydrolase [Desulfonema ishimotonii]|uniref:2-amino-thiazoline-4-carboxylic acid hydrolase n=1 Tax=Desulfonema ishimotonii TaxID=45657 RepID=A0A401FS21_9BACT|nr:L-2-amino-thiazoline-4-carboxylic acid hydrolase [Desulfonema ishimotonii]GBC59772.1 2-amino-thiazoline-4-carboxylic acid hydrolase [Desulfonema ishimotonii]